MYRGCGAGKEKAFRANSFNGADMNVTIYNYLLVHREQIMLPLGTNAPMIMTLNIKN